MMRGGNRNMRRMMDKELETPIFSDEDIELVCQQASVSKEKAIEALAEAKGDLARAILLLTTN